MEDDGWKPGLPMTTAAMDRVCAEGKGLPVGEKANLYFHLATEIFHGPLNRTERQISDKIVRALGYPAMVPRGRGGSGRG